MKRTSILARAVALAALLILPQAASAAGLDGFLAELDLRASSDMGAFRADLSVTFGVSSGKVDGLFRIVSKPSDVYMCLRLGEIADQPVDRVVEEYKKSKGQGWGAIAKSMGIEPGSDEFHALKAGRLAPRGGSSADSKSKGGKGKG